MTRLHGLHVSHKPAPFGEKSLNMVSLHVLFNSSSCMERYGEMGKSFSAEEHV